MPEPIPQPIQALMKLFDAELAAVEFPGVDAGSLAAAIQQATEAAESVERAETSLEVARAAKRACDEALLNLAHRALNYAKVYAEDSSELTGKLEALELPRPRRVKESTEPAQAPKRRGRPPKARDESASLFAPTEPPGADVG